MYDFLQIGHTLRSARESRQLSPEDITHKTRIPLKIIHALENDDYSVFSSSTYARSYLSQYSQYLEIDASAWLDAFEPAEFAHDYHSFSVIDEVDVREATQRAKPSGSSKLVPSLLALMLTAAVLFVGYHYLQEFEKRQKEKEQNTAGVSQADPQQSGETTTPSPSSEKNDVALVDTDDAEASTPLVAHPVDENLPEEEPEEAFIDSTPSDAPRAVIIEEEE
jgi:cytoskeleton protein RodZ